MDHITGDHSTTLDKANKAFHNRVLSFCDKENANLFV